MAQGVYVSRMSCCNFCMRREGFFLLFCFLDCLLGVTELFCEETSRGLANLLVLPIGGRFSLEIKCGP